MAMTRFTHPPSAAALASRGLCLGLALTAASAAMAQQAPASGASGSPGPAARALAHDIPTGALGPALSRFAVGAGITLSFDPALTDGRTTAGLQGSYTPGTGLAQLLAGSGLEAVPREGGGYTLRRAATTATPAGAPAAHSATLNEVKITAQAERSSGVTEGTGSYTAVGPSSTATGLGLTLRETPQSVTVMTRQRMDDFKLKTLTDVMEQTPGIGVYRQGSAVDFQARGSSVNLQTDGMRQLTSGWYYFTSTLYSLDDMAEIDRIEVLKGSSGLVNGAGAAGATINLIRKRPTKEFQANVGVSAGSWNNLRADVDVGGPLNESGSLRGRLVASAADAHTFRDHEKTNNQMLFGTLEADLAPDTLLNLGFTLRQRELRGSGSTQPLVRYTSEGAEVPWKPRSFNNGAPWAGYAQDATTLFGSLEQRLADGWTAKLQFSHQRVTMDEMLLGYLYDEKTAAFTRYQDIDNSNWGVNLDVKGPVELFGRKHELLAGAGVSRYQGDMQLGSGPGSRVPLSSLGLDYGQGGGGLVQPSFNGWSYAANMFSRKQRYVYAAGQFQLSDPLQLIAGLRVTDYDQRDVTPYWWNYDLKERGVTTPYAGLVYRLNDQVSLYGSYASIFEAQSGQDEQGRTLPPLDGLTYEVGAKGEFFDKRLNASISYFWMKTDNTAEETGGLTPGGDMAYRAVMGASRRGWELELSGELARGWQAQGSVVQQDSSLTTASQYPKHQFKLGTTYRLDGAVKGLTVGAATRWQSATSTTSGSATLAQKSYALVDLMARYQVNSQLSLSANINNVFDKKYLAGTTNFGSLHYTWGAPRSVNVSMRYTF